MHVIAHGGCTDAVRESAVKDDSCITIPLRHRGLEPVSVLRLILQSDALPYEPFPPSSIHHPMHVVQDSSSSATTPSLSPVPQVLVRFGSSNNGINTMK